MKHLVFVSQGCEACKRFKEFAPEFEKKYNVRFEYVDIEKPYHHKLVDGYRIDTVPSVVCAEDSGEARGILLMHESPNPIVLDDFLKVFS